MKLIKKICLIFVLCSLFIFCSNVKAINVLTPNWSAHTERYPAGMMSEDEMIMMLMLSTSATSFQGDFVMANADAKEFIENSNLITNLSIYSIDGNIKKNIKIEDYIVAEIISTKENIYLIVTDLTLNDIKMIKYDSNLNKQNETDIEIEIMAILESKYFGVSIGAYSNNKIYIMKEESNILEYDLELNLIQSHTNMTNENICNIFKKYCDIAYNSNTEMNVYGFDKKDNYKVETGISDNGGFIILYKDGKEVWSKTLNQVDGVFNPKIIKNQIIVSATNSNTLQSSIMIYDLEGNLKYQKDNLLNFLMLENDGAVLNYSLEIDLQTCLKDSNKCIIGAFNIYELALPTIGGTGGISIEIGDLEYDRFEDIAHINKNEYVVVGCTSSTELEGITIEGGTDAYIVKNDKNNNLIWQKSYGTKESESFYGVTIDSSENIIAVGETGSSALIVKYDKDGNLLWAKTYTATIYNKFKKVIVDKDDNYIVVVDKRTLVKYDKDGNILWEIIYPKQEIELNDGTIETISATFNSVISTTNGEYIVVGHDRSDLLSTLAIIIKYDKDGNIIWEQKYNYNSEYFDVIETKDGGFIAVGASGYEIPEPRDAIIVKYDKDGNQLWKRNYAQYAADINGITKTSDGGFIIVGYDYPYGGFIIKYNEDEEQLWEQNSISLTETNMSTLFSIIELSPNNYIAAGFYYKYENKELNLNGLIYNYKIEPTVKPKRSTDGVYEAILENDKVKITPLANEGYSLDKIIVKDSNGNEIECTAKDGSYYFDYNTLTTDATIEVLFKKNTIIEEIIENPNTITFLKLGFIAVIIFAIYNLFISKKLKVKRFA